MVSPVEGELRVRKDVELDRETTAFYNITVTARDLGTPPRNSSVGLYYTHTRAGSSHSNHILLNNQDLAGFTSLL